MGNSIVVFEPIAPRKRLSVALQGEGTYEYDCSNPDCYFCELMGLKSSVEVSECYQTFDYFHWTNREINRLKELISLNPKQLKPLFPRRSISAISTQKTNLKQKHLAA